MSEPKKKPRESVRLHVDLFRAMLDKLERDDQKEILRQIFRLLEVPGCAVCATRNAWLDATVPKYVKDLRREMAYDHFSDEQKKVLRLALKWFHQDFGLDLPADLA